MGNYTENVGQSGEKWGNSNIVPNALSLQSAQTDFVAERERGPSGAVSTASPPEANVFLGEFQHSVDSKGRLAIPARFRSKIERGAVLTRGVETCLFVYTLETWEQKARELDASLLDPRQRRMVERRFFGMAFECELDAQGRIVLPARYRQYAGLNGEAVVVGARDRFEVWSPAEWERYLDETSDVDLNALALPF